MIVLVINSGSSSLKYELFNLRNEKSLFSGEVSRIGMEGAEHSYTCAGKKTVLNVSAPDHKAAEYLETPLRRLNIVSCHLGNGASVCAIERGHSIKECEASLAGQKECVQH